MSDSTIVNHDDAIKAEERVLMAFEEPKAGSRAEDLPSVWNDDAHQEGYRRSDAAASCGAGVSGCHSSSSMHFDSVTRHLDKLAGQGGTHIGGKWALCFSGGGIRSASICLGVLQGLAKRGVLPKFHYLSTVSGGGYIGSWFSAWVRRANGGIDEVQRELAATREQEAAPLQHLRKYAQFLSPDAGAMSADLWTMVATYLRNLLLNWIVMLPLLAAVGLAGHALLTAADATGGTSASLVTALQLGVAILLGIAYGTMSMYLPSEAANTHALANARPSPLLFWLTLVVCVLGVIASSASLTGYTLCVPRAAVSSLVWAFVLPIALSLAVARLAQRLGPPSANSTPPAHISLLVILPLFLAACLVAWLLSPQFDKPGASGGLGLKPVSLWGFALPAQLAGTLAAWLAFAWLRWFGLWKRLLPALFTRDIWRLILQLAGVPSFVAAIGAGGLLFFLFELIRRALVMLAAIPAYGEVLWFTASTPLVLLAFFCAGSLLSALLSRLSKSSDADREWLARLGGWLLLLAGSWVIACVVLLLLPAMWLSVGTWVRSLTAGAGGTIGLVALVLGKSSATSGSEADKQQNGLLKKLLTAAPALAAPAAIALIVSLVSLISLWAVNHLSICADPTMPDSLLQWDHRDYNTLHTRSWFAAAYFACALALVLFVFAASLCIHFNKFTMHGFYRDRLIRTFLGASNQERQNARDPFTDFADTDNIWMHELHPVTLRPSDWTDEKRRCCFLKEICSLARDGSLTPDTFRSRLGAAVRDSERSGRARTPITRLMKTVLADFDREGCISGDREQAILSAVNHALMHFDLVGGRTTPDPRANRAGLQAEFGSNLPPPSESFGTPFLQRFDQPSPLHVINMTLNSSQMQDTGRKQRQAYHFSSTCLHSGSPTLGYRPSSLYGGPQTLRNQAPRVPRGISLGTVVAISGAAASPNMGYHTSPAVAFLLTLFNVRLGAWLGNPGPAGERTYRQASPTLGILQTVTEFFGLTSEKSSYVYLSDGGHFENLAVYSMLQRRCSVIVVVDAGCDPQSACEDLGRLVRIAKIDLGISINFNELGASPLTPDPKAHLQTTYFANVHYPATPGRNDNFVGRLIYIKPRAVPDAPISAGSYHAANKDFPHQSTGDQFYTEDQFEAHRALGEHLVTRS